MIKKPFLSIIIPTRDRHETLKYTLNTILKQEFDDYEIIISDNYSSNKTKEIIENIDSDKIVYTKTKKILSLSDNWENGISLAKGEYLTVIADNDAFIDNTLSFLKELIVFNNYPKLINLNKNNYNWSSFPTINRNKLFLNIEKANLSYVNGHKLIKNVLKNTKEFYKLPMIYNSIVHQSLINKMIKNNRVFNSITPDIYSGFCLAYLAKNYLRLSTPLTIGGNSAKSIGVYVSYNNKKNILKKELKAKKESIIKIHKYCPLVLSHSSHTFDSFLKAKETLNIKKIKLSRKKILIDSIKDTTCFSNDELLKAKQYILNTVSDNKSLIKFTNKLLDKFLKVNTLTKPYKLTNGFKEKKLILEGQNFNIKNIEDCSKFMSNFYEYKIENLNFPEISNDLWEIPKFSNIAIWGRGESSKELLNIIKKQRKDLNIKCIIDSFYENKKLKPKIIKPNNISNDIDYIIIASMFILEINQSIEQLNIKKKVFRYRYI